AFIEDSVAPFDRESCIKNAIATFEELKTYGLKSYVDATPIDLGLPSRNADILKEISEKTGVNIICATGVYYEKNGAAGYYHFRSNIPLFDVVKEMEEVFVKEITEGIGKTGIKAGVIKVATGHGAISPYEETALKAAAKAQKETGVPIISHTEAGTMGPEQADLLIAEGADPKQMMIGHANGNGDIKYHTAILDKGVYLGFDRLGIEVPQEMSDRWSMACIIGLIGIGFANRIMMSHDYIMTWLGRPLGDILSQVQPNWHARHVFKDLVPALKEAGVTDDKIKTILIDNPRRLFAGL
ncbi:MAG: phosphotriesterase-related protein, partial [Deltaproteobacteria bacterium]|nr:phosphotriesterase-related protein [Deltaproteobacteria bacterium]